MSLFDFLTHMLDMVAPPRPSECLVRTLTLSDLYSIQLRGEKSGSLPYHDPRVTALVWELKYYANKHAAQITGTLLSDVLIGIASETLGQPLLIPVPMHASRKRQRGHNQTELLCEAALVHMPGFYEYAPKILVRTRATPPQQTLHKHERTHNLIGSMCIKEKSKVAGRVCVVVDDVSTTGATFAEATRALKDAGAAHIQCIALAYS